MANTYCHEGYCNLARKKEENGDKLLVIGISAAIVLCTTTALFYANSHGIYIDPTLLP